MSKQTSGFFTRAEVLAWSWVGWQLCQSSALGNPAGGTVTQGTATFNTSGNVMTITTSAYSAINWQSFNIGAGETTTFVQPSSTSIVWNNVSSGNPATILGSINANGYVILQDQGGITVGGQAAITARGVLLTTSPTPAPDLATGGAWSFNSLPPAASIVNYGQINTGSGGSAFLIAGDIENYGTISAPSGKIGLYDGKQVMVSMSPDGRGLSAAVTLPQGSVDNEGNLVADGGTIAAQAQTVNQNGLVQANSVQNINGVIELVASGNLTLGANSDIEAHGDNTDTSAASPGGMVVLQAGGAFSDTSSSVINVAAGTGGAGGQDGIVEVFGNNLTDATAIQSQIDGMSASQFAGQDILLVNPYDLTLSYNPTTTGSANPNLSLNDLAAYAQIDIHALDNIELQSPWSLSDPGAPASLTLNAGNSILIDDGANISAGNNWSVNLFAGTAFVPTTAQPTPPSGTDGIYLNCSAYNQDSTAAYIQTQNGDINLWAANEILVAPGGSDSPNGDEPGYSGITTLNGGNINVTTLYGDVSAGANPVGYTYHNTAPYYTVASGLGGISTAAGGNVTINAGGDVISYLPVGDTSTAAQDGGTGAFGPEPGNVSITAGGSVYGHYVVANGTGVINAGQDAGSDNQDPIALSLISGSWTVNAGGNIYLQEVRNPNGAFNDLSGSRRAPNAGQFLFNYAQNDFVDLDAGDGVYLTDDNVPRQPGNNDTPVLYPPGLEITAGAGGVTLDGNVTLFPSPDQNLSITTTDGGSLTAPLDLSNPVQLLMSESAATHWTAGSTTIFSASDNNTGAPIELNNPTPVTIDISGNMENLDLITSKETQIKVGGNMDNCGFSGQNLHSSDVTSITVGGQIFNQGSYVFISLPGGIPNIPAQDLPPSFGYSWQDIFTLAMNPLVIASLAIPSYIKPSEYASYALSASIFGSPTQPLGVNPGFIYNASTGQLGYAGPMSSSVLAALANATLTVLRYGANGVPETYTRDGQTYFVTDQVHWVAPKLVEELFTLSQASSPYEDIQLGYRIGGPGQFDIDAGSISLGNSYGILSVGVHDVDGGFDRYENLGGETPLGAEVNVTVAGDLDMLTSTIASLGGGDVNVTSTGGSMDLGTESLLNTPFIPFRPVGLGIYTAGAGNTSDVNVTAEDNIDIDGSRIAAYDGGNIFVESLDGSVDIGSGLSTANGVYVTFVNPRTKEADYFPESPYGSGIVADTLAPPLSGEVWPPNVASLPGDITVEAPHGNITASLGGITQISLSGNIASGPYISLSAGTPGEPGSATDGNIDLGEAGVIGGSVNATATRNINIGLVLARQSVNIVAQQNVNVTAVAGGQADVSGGDSVTGTIVGIGGANVSGNDVTATVLSQNASVNGGAAQSTLGTSVNASSAAQSAANQSDSQAKQQLAENAGGTDDDQKKKGKKPVLQRVKRVTVILPGKS